DQVDEREEESNETDTSDDDLRAKGFEYLLGMKIWSLTHERAEELRHQRAEKNGELWKMKATLPEEMWLNDLDAVEALLDERDAALGIDSSRQQTFSMSEKKPRAKVAAKKAPAKGTCGGRKTARASAYAMLKARGCRIPPQHWSNKLFLHCLLEGRAIPSWAPSPQLVKCGRTRSGCEKTRGISKWKS
ncbi:hypothetical protein THAOC_28673, partial [Thalassiosira oceanica]